MCDFITFYEFHKKYVIDIDISICYDKLGKQKKKGGVKMLMEPETLVAVHTHTHTHTGYYLINIKKIMMKKEKT